MAPVIRALQADQSFTVKVCVTAQYRKMLDQVLTFFGIIPNHDLNLMKPGQTLVDITADALRGLDRVIELEDPDVVMVQGDTTSAFVGALAKFYRRVKVAHVEAGLRSGDRYSPFPEEVNRVLAGHLAEFHFAPTERAAQNLFREGITRNYGSSAILLSTRFTSVLPSLTGKGKSAICGSISILIFQAVFFS